MRPPALLRRPCGVVVAVLLAATGSLLVAEPASAESPEPYFAQDFDGPTLEAAYPVNLPAVPASALNSACLTALGAHRGAVTTCNDTADTRGDGVLQLNRAARDKTGALFSASGVPLYQGLDVTFSSYQFGRAADPADGLAFVLAAVDPTLGTPPATAGNLGGSLGYSASGTVPGVARGYLGIGLDVYGAYSNSEFQGSGCADPAFVTTTRGGRTPGQVVVRGPGNGQTGYCALNSTAAVTPGKSMALHSTGRSTSRVPVEVAINPADDPVTTVSGLRVDPDSYLVAVTQLGGEQRIVTGSLPRVPAGLYPEGWLGAKSRPLQLALGFTAGTGGSFDAHAVSDVVARPLTTARTPRLTVSAKAFVHEEPLNADPLTFSVRTTVTQADEGYPVTVTAVVPDGVSPLAGVGDGWTCTIAGQRVTCKYQWDYLFKGTVLPELRISGRVTPTGVSVASVAATPIGVSAADVPTVRAPSIPVSDPASTLAPVLTPASGPAGTTVTISGVDAAQATLVQVGSNDQITSGTAQVFPRCTTRTTSTCFQTTPGGAIRLPAIPETRTTSTLVAISNLSAIRAGRFTYTNRPGAPVATAEAGGESASVSWSAPPSGGSPITGYTVTTYLDGRPQTPRTSVPANQTSTTVINLTPRRSYTFAMTATNANGTSELGPRSEPVAPLAYPGRPPAPTLTLVKGSLVATWQQPADNGGTPVTAWVLRLRSGDVVVSEQSVGEGASPYTYGRMPSGSSYSLSVSAINAAGVGPDSPRSAEVPVDNPPLLTLAPPQGEVGAPYDTTVSTRGGARPFIWTTTGALPPGLHLVDGRLSGTPARAGTYTFSVTVTDAAGQRGSTPVQVVVAPALAPGFAAELPAAGVARPYRHVLSATGGATPITFAVTSGSLPPGLSLDAATGTISGTPTHQGTTDLTVTLTDPLGATATQPTSIAVIRTTPIPPPRR